MVIDDKEPVCAEIGCEAPGDIKLHETRTSCVHCDRNLRRLKDGRWVIWYLADDVQPIVQGG